MHDKKKQLGANQTASPPVKHDDFCDARGRVQSSVGDRDLDHCPVHGEESVLWVHIVLAAGGQADGRAHGGLGGAGFIRDLARLAAKR